LTFSQEQGFRVRGLLRSPVVGPKGNVEFLAWLEVEDKNDMDLAVLVKKILDG
jgi:predicted rRNA methylase YqxC with S4 and FtsJ domains